MRLAVVGVDGDVLRLVGWAVCGRHEMVAGYGAAGRARELLAASPGVRLSENWEELLSGPATVDAVIVAAADARAVDGGYEQALAERGEQVRRLTQAKLPLIVVCPTCEAIVGLEIEMIRSDLGSVIVPYVPGALHPAVFRLAEMVMAGGDGLIGAVQQIVFEREQADRGRPAVMRQLARDTALLRQLIGRVQTVTASGPARATGRDPMGPRPTELPEVNNLSVVLGGDDGLTARWSVGPRGEAEAGRVIVTGDRGKAILTMPAEGPWSLDVAGDECRAESFEQDADLEPVFWQLMHSQPAEPLYDEGAWLAACRDQEAVEAVDRSLVRGRTIELFHEELSEGASFKGVMAMGGCLMLVLAFCVLLLVSLVEGLQLPLRDVRTWRLWPVLLLAPLGGFLLLQLLGFAVKPRSSAADGLTRSLG